MTERVLWDLMQMEARERYYIDRHGFRAEKPAIIISTGVFRAPEAKKTEFYTVWLGQGLAHWNFRSLKKAREKAHEILATARVPIRVRVEKR